MKEKCFYCDKPATRFCDFNIGAPIGGYERAGPVADNRFLAYIDAEQLPYTCDMPMCDDHNKQVGHFHICGKEPVHETIDHCPEHVDKREDISPPCREEEAEAIRRGIRAQAKRKMIRASNQLTTQSCPPAP